MFCPDSQCMKYESANVRIIASLTATKIPLCLTDCNAYAVLRSRAADGQHHWIDTSNQPFGYG